MSENKINVKKTVGVVVRNERESTRWKDEGFDSIEAWREDRLAKRIAKANERRGQ